MTWYLNIHILANIFITRADIYFVKSGDEARPTPHCFDITNGEISLKLDIQELATSLTSITKRLDIQELATSLISVT